MRTASLNSSSVYSPATGSSGKFRNTSSGADVNANLQVNGTKNIIYSTASQATLGNIYAAHGVFDAEL
jgi:hypothetical protein